MSEGTKPDKEKAQMLFEHADDDDLLDEVDDVDDEEGASEVKRTTSLTDRGRIIEVPAPGVVGGYIQVASNTMVPAAMREFRDSIIALVQNEQNSAHQA